MIGHRGPLAMWLAVVVAVVAACDAGTPTPSPGPTFEPDPTPVSTTYEMGTHIWYEGLELDFDRVTSTLDARGGPVELLLGIKNPTTDDSTLDGKVTIVVGTIRMEPTRESVIPIVPAGGSVAVVLTFELQKVTSIEAARFEVGDAPLHVARVPVTAAGDPPLTFEPVALSLKGAATAKSLKLTLRAGTLRWDLPDWSQELDASLASLTLVYDATYAGDFAGGFAFTGDNVALRLPDGSLIGARRDGHSQSVELIGARKTKKNLSSRFEIPAGVPGQYALVVKDGSTTKAIVFTIEG